MKPLDRLFHQIISGEVELDDSLPAFGPWPDNTIGIWSWDDTRLLEGTCVDDLRIVDRSDNQ